MPRPRPLIDPRLQPSLQPSFFTRRVSIQAFADGAATASGFVPRTPATLAGHDGIPAAIEPIDNRGNEEKRREEMTVAESTHQILLLGFFPDITPLMRAVDDAGEAYDISKRDVDSHQTLTRLMVRQVTPVAEAGA